MKNHSEEITQPEEENGSLLKKKTKKINDPNKAKKVLSDGQKKALVAMNDARTKKAEEKLKLKYMKIMEKEQKAQQAQQQVPVPPNHDSESSESSSEEVQMITKPTRIKEPKQKTKKKTKKIIVIEESSSDSESEPEPDPEPEIIYKSRHMKSQQNRRSIIQQHNEKQINKNFFCN
jgi:hypothetical protein